MRTITYHGPCAAVSIGNVGDFAHGVPVVLADDVEVLGLAAEQWTVDPPFPTSDDTSPVAASAAPESIDPPTGALSDEGVPHG